MEEAAEEPCPKVEAARWRGGFLGPFAERRHPDEGSKMVLLGFGSQPA